MHGVEVGVEVGEELRRKATWNYFAFFVSDFHVLSMQNHCYDDVSFLTSELVLSADFFSHM